jgi:hypothetical protein
MVSLLTGRGYVSKVNIISCIFEAQLSGIPFPSLGKDMNHIWELSLVSLLHKLCDICHVVITDSFYNTAPIGEHVTINMLTGGSLFYK